jgi:hypothetical protein
MSTEIEGEVREVDEERAIVVRQPDRLAQAPTPEDTLSLATRMATALKDVVEKQKLFAVIQGKKYPQVEAWMTIARMDNVVAREARPPVRHDDGSYEGFVELIRLSDGMVVGGASALCGSPDDEPWGGTAAKWGKDAKPPRPEHARRSMAVTRATSRAFRQQYSWIMALAGYEPTPAEEMPRDEGPKTVVWSKADNEGPRPEPERSDDGGLIGTVELGKGDADFELRQTPDGWVTAFRLVSGRKSIKAIAHQPFAELLVAEKDALLGKTVTAWGRISDETFRPKGATTDVTYQVLTLDRIKTSELDLTAPEPADELDAIAEGLPA